MESWHLRLCAIICLSPLGCGPTVSVSTDSEDGTDDGTSDVMSGEAVSGSGDGPVPVTTGPSTITTTTTTAVPVTSEVTGVLDGSSGEVQGECWTSTPLGDMPSYNESRLFDHDGDGVDELWLVRYLDSNSALFAIDYDGALLDEFMIQGSFIQLADVDGDGLGDLTALLLNGGAPNLLYDLAVAPYAFGGDVQQFALTAETGSAAFLDVVDSPAADAIETTSSSVRLHAGLGDGSFELAGEVAVEGAIGSHPIPVRGAADRFAMMPHSPGADVCDRGVTRVFTSQPEFTLVAESSAATPVGFLGPAMLAIATDDGGTRVYRTLCTADGVGVVAQQGVPGSLQMQDTVLAPDSDWAAVADLDGDGTLDLLSQHDGLVLYAQGVDDDSFLPEVEINVAPLEVARNRVHVGDTDGDGRDELILAATTPGSVLQRVELGPCD